MNVSDDEAEIIASFLDYRDLVRLELVSKQMRSLIKHDIAGWGRAFLNIYNVRWVATKDFFQAEAERSIMRHRDCKFPFSRYSRIEHEHLLLPKVLEMSLHVDWKNMVEKQVAVARLQEQIMHQSMDVRTARQTLLLLKQSPLTPRKEQMVATCHEVLRRRHNGRANNEMELQTKQRLAQLISELYECAVQAYTRTTRRGFAVTPLSFCSKSLQKQTYHTTSGNKAEAGKKLMWEEEEEGDNREEEEKKGVTENDDEDEGGTDRKEKKVQAGVEDTEPHHAALTPLKNSQRHNITANNKHVSSPPPKLCLSPALRTPPPSDRKASIQVTPLRHTRSTPSTPCNTTAPSLVLSPVRALLRGGR